MIWQSEQRVNESVSQMDAEELKNSKMSQGIDMMDKVLQISDNKMIKKATAAWRYI